MGGSEIISAVVPTAAVRRLLDIPSGTAVMEVLRLGCLRTQPIEWRETLIRGDRFSVAAEWSAHEGYRMTVSGDRSGPAGPDPRLVCPTHRPVL